MIQYTYIFVFIKVLGYSVKINSINNIEAAKNQIRFQKTSSNNTQKSSFDENNNISNIYYSPLSFGRSWSEHKSWGASIDPKTKETSFKLFTYPDTKKVTVTVQKRDNNIAQKTVELKNKGQGVFESTEKLKPTDFTHGDKYYFTIYKGNGNIDIVKDPYAARQESLLGASTLYDHSLFNWSDNHWYEKDSNRISRRANNQNKLKSIDDARIYELNIASFTKKGTFKAAKSKLKSLKDMGFNAIEIMPVENTYSFNWGYDGVDKFAPSEHLGGPDELKDLINYAHNIGLNVIMDMVPNHIGPDGSAFRKTGPYVKGNNCFGEAWNFEGRDSRYVRDLMVNAAINWIDNYHCDGLRLDMTKFMESDYTMKQIAAEINYHRPDAFLIAEDSRANVGVNKDGSFYDNYDEPHDKRVTNPLKQFESAEGQSENEHCNAIENISQSKTSLGRLGYDSEWDFNYFHSLKDGLYGVVDLDRFEKAIYCSQDRVKYVMSHDEIGNYEGSRLIAKLMVPMLHLNENIILGDEDLSRAEKFSKLKNCSIDDAKATISAQKAQFCAEKLAIMLQTGELDKYNTNGLTSKRWVHAIEQAFKDEVLEPLGIDKSSGITLDLIKTMYLKSFDINKMALARTFSIPGPKMIFQGDEKADMTPFRFFREFQSIPNEDYLYYEKGYKPGRSALEESKLGSLRYTPSAKNIMNKFSNLTKDLNILNEKNPALTRGTLIPENTVKHQASQLLATHSVDNESKNEIFTITNFNAADYPRIGAADYYINFPQGQWVEILNTDDKKYGGNGNINTSPVYSDGQHNSPIKISGYSTLIFKRVV